MPRAAVSPLLVWRARIQGAQTLVSPNLRPKDLLGPVTRVQKKKKKVYFGVWGFEVGGQGCGVAPPVRAETRGTVSSADTVFGKSHTSLGLL